MVKNVIISGLGICFSEKIVEISHNDQGNYFEGK